MEHKKQLKEKRRGNIYIISPLLEINNIKYFQEQ